MFNDFKMFEKYFMKFLPNHDHATRRFKFILPPVRLEMEKQSPIFQSIKYFNTLPEFLTAPMSDFKFNKSYKNFIMEQYFSNL